MRISDWSSDVCSSDLPMNFVDPTGLGTALPPAPCGPADICVNGHRPVDPDLGPTLPFVFDWDIPSGLGAPNFADPPAGADGAPASPQKEDDNETDGWQCRSEEHTSELQSLMRISYAVFCLKNKNNTHEKRCIETDLKH